VMGIVYKMGRLRFLAVRDSWMLLLVFSMQVNRCLVFPPKRCHILLLPLSWLFLKKILVRGNAMVANECMKVRQVWGE